MSKASPFILSDDALAKLVAAASYEPAVLDLVGQYRDAASNFDEFAEMVTAEMQHFGIA